MAGKAAATAAQSAEAEKWMREHRKDLPRMKARVIPRVLDHRTIERKESSDPINRREVREMLDDGLEFSEIGTSYGAETIPIAANSAVGSASADCGTRNAAVGHDPTRPVTLDDLVSRSLEPETIAIIHELRGKGRLTLPDDAMLREVTVDYD